jgi:hypothetical protein
VNQFAGAADIRGALFLCLQLIEVRSAAAPAMRATSGVPPASTSANISRSTLPPLEHQPDPLAAHRHPAPAATRQRRRAGAFGQVVRVLVDRAHGGGNPRPSLTRTMPPPRLSV